jgi:hypothetical protein
MTKYEIYEHTFTRTAPNPTTKLGTAQSRGVKRIRLPDQATIFTAEATAIKDEATGRFEEWERKLIITDSLITLSSAKQQLQPLLSETSPGYCMMAMVT